MKRENKKGQVWIETVTYTLVAFILIGLVLAFAKPKIEELQDKAVIEQSMNVLKEMDKVVNEIYENGAGNKRKLEVGLKKGDIKINSTGDSITFIFEGRYIYSEPGQPYKEGSLDILTTELGTNYEVTIKRQFENINIKYFDEEETKTITASSTPYMIFIENKGGSTPVINFEVE